MLLGVEARQAFYSETPTETIRELERQIETLQQQDRALLDQQAAAEVRLGFARNLADKAAEQLARGLAFGRADITQSGTLIDFVQQQIDRAQAALREVQQQRRELSKQIEKLNNELNQRRAERPRERLTAVVEIEVKQAGDLTLDLTYVIGQCGVDGAVRSAPVRSERGAFAADVSGAGHAAHGRGLDRRGADALDGAAVADDGAA